VESYLFYLLGDEGIKKGFRFNIQKFKLILHF
jgi:hypothetical protein